MTIRPLQPNDVAVFHQCVCENVDWLLGRGITQWRRPIPRRILDDRQKRGWNYGLYSETGIEAFGCLVEEFVPAWEECVPRKALWIRTLTTPPRNKGKGFGRLLVLEFIRMAREREGVDLCLECTTSPFLNRYYQSLGFHLAGQKIRIYEPDNAPFQMMCYRFGSQGAGVVTHTG